MTLATCQGNLRPSKRTYQGRAKTADIQLCPRAVRNAKGMKPGLDARVPAILLAIIDDTNGHTEPVEDE